MKRRIILGLSVILILTLFGFGLYGTVFAAGGLEEKVIGNADISQYQFTIHIMPIEFRLKEISNLYIEPNGTVKAVYLVKNHSTQFHWHVAVNVYTPQNVLVRAVWKDTGEYYIPGTEFQIANGCQRELEISFTPSFTDPAMSYGETLPIDVEAFLTYGVPGRG